MRKICKDCKKTFPKTNEFFDEKTSYYNNITLGKKVYYISLTTRCIQCNHAYTKTIQRLTYQKYHEKSRIPIYTHIKGIFLSSRQEPYYEGEFDRENDLQNLLSLRMWDLSESEIESYIKTQKIYRGFNKIKSLKILKSIKHSDLKDEELEIFNNIK